jgi:pyrroline-5-carboxylate reductase
VNQNPGDLRPGFFARQIRRTMSYELAILGAGNMAEAIARGVTQSKLLTPDQIIAADPAAPRRALFERELHIRTADDNAAAARDARTILLSVKPQQMADVLAGLAPVLRNDVLIVSIAAGISTGFIERNLGAGKAWRVVRAMPNTPMLVAEGMVAIARGAHATSDDLATARRLFESAADVIEVPEDQIDAVTALSGSGPAYFFFLVEHMTRAGVEMGLSPENAHRLATKTALGSAKMLMNSSDSPQELRRKVTSPGGTTHAAITHMESQGMPQIVVDALKAAQRRGRELGK